MFLTTITPSDAGPHGTPQAGRPRDAVNRWVRAQGPEHAAGVFDFAAAVADPAHPERLAAAADAGDGLHLSAAGYRALAAAVPVTALTGSPCLADGPTRRVSRSRTAAPGARCRPGRRRTGDHGLERRPRRRRLRLRAGSSIAMGIGPRGRWLAVGVLAVEPVDHPVDGQRARRHAALGGDAAQLLDAQRRAGAAGTPGRTRTARSAPSGARRRPPESAAR